MIRAIIVDDEETGRMRLHKLSNANKGLITIIDEADNVETAYEKINLLKPDLVLLDVQMPVQGGFDLLEKFKTIDFDIVFTTAFSEFAIKAIQFSAIDYLLKPINDEDFLRMLGKVLNKKREEVQIRVDNLLSNLKKTNHLEKLVIPELDGLSIIDLQDIIACEANSNYTIFKLVNGDSVLSTKTLKEYEDILSGENFFRIHKSTLVNLKHVVKYNKGEGGFVIMKDNSSFEVSRRKKSEFLEQLASAF